MKNYKFTLDGLHCAGCAAKIETAIANHEGTENTTLNFAAKTISFSCNSNAEKEVQLWTQSIVDSIEQGVTVAPHHSNTKITQKKKDNEWLKIIIALGLFVIAILCERVFNLPAVVYATAYGLSVIICGYKVFIAGFHSIKRLKLDENTLMAIAVLAAFCIGEFAEASLVTLLFAIGEALEDRAVNKSRRDIEKLAEIRPDTASLLLGSSTTIVPAQKINVGDTIIIKPFERVPLDGTVIKGVSSMDASALTGESLPVTARADSQVMSGMMNGEGLLTVRVTKSYENSSASRIIKMVEDAAAAKGSSERFITKFAQVYTPIVMVLAVMLVVIPTIITGDFTTWLSRALVFLVASCPCAIVISVPLGFYSGIGGASKVGVLIKGGKYIEALAKADTFVFDKTGTLTAGKLTVNTLKSCGRLTEHEIIAMAAAVEENSVHPVATAIKLKAKGLELPILTDYTEIPGIGVSAMKNGTKIACGSYRILKESHGKKGVIYLTVNGEPEGEITVADTIRDEAPAITQALKRLGGKTIAMLTGDDEAVAKSVASQCSITEYHAGLLPQDKVKIMTSLKVNSTKCVFVGDGINDAPVIAVSDCGIAMGLGSEAAIEAADAVLSSGNLKQLPAAVKIARRVLSVVKANIIFALSVKVIILVLAALGYAPMWLAVFADTGVSMLCVLNSSRLLRVKK